MAFAGRALQTGRTVFRGSPVPLRYLSLGKAPEMHGPESGTPAGRGRPPSCVCSLMATSASSCPHRFLRASHSSVCP